jgi:hypothetical protein
MTIPQVSRECALMAESWTQLLQVTAEDVEALWSAAIDDLGSDAIRALHATTQRETAVEIYRADYGLMTLWIGETRLARHQR